LTSGYIFTVSRNQIKSTMDLPVELVQLLQHAETYKLIPSLYRSSWCGSRLENPLKKQGKLPARPQKRSTSHLPPGEETPNHC
jgi:hypothetical protein